MKIKKPKVELVKVRSLSKKDGMDWHDIFKVNIKVDGERIDFEDALQDGVLKACQRLYSPKLYDYKSFDYWYSRNPKRSKRMFED